MNHSLILKKKLKVEEERDFASLKARLDWGKREEGGRVKGSRVELVENKLINSLFGWKENRGRERKLNYLIWIFFKGGGKGIWRGSNYF